jgi:hypothetical protein
MRILSTLDELDPLPMFGERIATPRPAEKASEPLPTNDWRYCTRADLQSPGAPESVTWRDADGDEFKVTKRPSEMERHGRAVLEEAICNLNDLYGKMPMYTTDGVHPNFKAIDKRQRLHPGNVQPGGQLVFKSHRIGSTAEHDAKLVHEARMNPEKDVLCVRPSPAGVETLRLKGHHSQVYRIRDFFAVGWTREQLVDHGYAEWVAQ